MMKYTGTVSLGAGLLILLPNLAPGEEGVGSLEAALGQTLRSLEILAGAQAEIARGAPEAVGLIQGLTEAPLEGDRERDERLVRVRAEVNLLAAEWEALQGLSLTASNASTAPTSPLPGTGPLAVGPPPATVEKPTTGLSALQRQALATGTDPGASTPAGAAGSTLGAARPGDFPEHDGYSADPLAQAQACYRAGRFEQAILLLGPLDSDANALYWKARSLERLERLGEAIETYHQVLAASDSESLKQRVRTSLDFLEWKERFVEKLPQGAKLESPAGTPAGTPAGKPEEAEAP